MPIKDVMQEVFQQEALTLSGVKIVFYEKGFIIVDQRVGQGVVLYEDIEKVCFYTADEQWLEIRVKEAAMTRLPCNIMIDGTILIKVNTNIVNDKYKVWK